MRYYLKGEIGLNIKITETGISDFVRFLGIVCMASVLWITKQMGMAFWGSGVIVGIVSIFFSPGYFLNKIVFNYFKRLQKKGK
ncbi:hypothetical protein EFP95_08615 [Lentilactobacillus hilgardii]|nr:hypothetical protein [Lentilactobacillus hilgardii]